MDDPRVGTLLEGRYLLLRRIGAGGTGVVYEAEQTAMGRMVAVKMLSAHVAADPEWVARFRDEAMTCARLQHPNTIRIYDVGQTLAGDLYMAMELLEGQSLRQVLRHGPMAATRVLRVLMQTCASLAEAHSIGIVHRDIKADNIFLLQMTGVSDYVKVLDFSVAKLIHESAAKTRAGIILGTPQYMSPEQCRGLPLDARSDLYSLGILAYEMATGTLPFHHADPREVLAMQLREPVPALPASVPAPLAQLITRALEKDPANRFQHAGEWLQHAERALEVVLQSPSARAISARPPSIMPATAPGVGPTAHTVGVRLDPSQKTLVGVSRETPAAPAVALPPAARTMIAEPGAHHPPAPHLSELPTELATAAHDDAPTRRHPNEAPKAATEIMPAPARAASSPPPVRAMSPRVASAVAHAGPATPQKLRARDWLLLGLLGLFIGITAFAAVRFFLAP